MFKKLFGGDPKPEPAQPAPQPVAPPPAPPPEPKTSRILVIEDDPELTTLIADFLEAQGYKVSTAADGWAGVVQAEALRIDLVITDICMPGPEGTGIDAYNRLRSSKSMRPDLPIIFVTALAAERVQKLQGLPHCRLFFKPIDLPALHQAIQELLGR